MVTISEKNKDLIISGDLIATPQKNTQPVKKNLKGLVNKF